jgi:hypothetical protein
MPIDSSVAELITAQLFVLSQEAPDPIFFYINSTGIAVRGGKGPFHPTARGTKPRPSHAHMPDESVGLSGDR